MLYLWKEGSRMWVGQELVMLSLKEFIAEYFRLVFPLLLVVSIGEGWYKFVLRFYNCKVVS